MIRRPPRSTPLYSSAASDVYKRQEVCRCYSMVKPLVKSIKLVIFDRGFFSKDLILTLNKACYPYLIFVPKNKKVKKELEEMALYEKKKIIYELKLNKDKTVIKGDTTLALLKNIFDKRSGIKFDWSFATNQSEINLDSFVPTYKCRSVSYTHLRAPRD